MHRYETHARTSFLLRVFSDSDVSSELLYAKSKGKKIVVSMGSVAASGGYYISQCADFIVASPFTITGRYRKILLPSTSSFGSDYNPPPFVSIGVIFGKMVVAQLAAKLGLTFDKFSINENGRIASAIGNNRRNNSLFLSFSIHSSCLFVLDKFTAEEKKKVDEMIDVIYEDFKAKAAAGRHLSLEALEQVPETLFLPFSISYSMYCVEFLACKGKSVYWKSCA